MVNRCGIFEREVTFDPQGDLEQFLASIPAKWVAYLFADERGQPIQLLCVKNLRASLRRRLGGEEMVGPSRRVNYREVVRRVMWRRVDSAFEADWVYLEAARELFPESYRGMVGFRPAWFVHVDAGANFPRWVKTTSIEGSGVRAQGSGEEIRGTEAVRGRHEGTEARRHEGRKGDPALETQHSALSTRHLALFVGPVGDKHAAQRLVEEVEDAFDLCRYYNILVEAPHGRACAYKQMGKCPAPCDGSIPMEQYHQMIRRSAAVLVEPGEFLAEQKKRMEDAARELRFEAAAKIKALIGRVEGWRKGAFRHARRLEDFAFLTLQRGPRAGTAKAFLICGGRIEDVAGIIGEVDEELAGELLRIACDRAQGPGAQGLDETGVERIGAVAHQLFSAKKTGGEFLRLSETTEKAVIKAWRDLAKQKAAQDSEGEGVTRELDAMAGGDA